MSRELRLAFGAALVVVVVLIWLLLSMGWALGWYLLGGFLAAHGCVHLFFVLPEPERVAAAGRRIGLTASEARLVGSALVATVAMGFLFAGLTTVLPSPWWSPLVLISSVASIGLLALFFRRQLFLGLVIDAVLLAVVVTGVWVP